MTRWTTSKAGDSGLGAKTWHLKPSRAAACASMRPNWPPPRIPIVAPGSSTGDALLTRRILRPFGDAGGLTFAPRFQPAAQAGIAQRQNARRQKCGVDRARLADGERADRNAGRHLHNRI